MNKLVALTFIFHLLISALPFAQEVPKIIQFKRTDYNAAHQNWMITQDCEGYLYVANSDGLLIFNGFKWQQIALPQNQRPRAVYLGKDCKVYTGGYEIFGYIDISDRSSPAYRPVADSLLKNTNEEIWNIFGKEDQIIFQSFSLIYKYDYQSTTQIISPSNIMLGRHINNDLYIPKIQQGLYKIEGDQVVAVSAAARLPENAKIADLCASAKSGEIILGTQYNGIFKLENDQLHAIKSELNERLKKEQINKLIRLNSGSYVIGTILNGVYITDDFIKVKYHVNKSNGLSNNTVLSLFEDKNNDLWLGLDKGINQVKISDPITYLYDRQGRLGTIFTAIRYNNTLYLGTNQGVFKANPDGTFSLINDSQGQIWSFIEVDGDLICGHNNGTYLIKDDAFIKVSNITGGWWMEVIGDKRILQSTYTGLVILEKKDGKWSLASRVKDGKILIEKFVLSGNTLIGNCTYSGVCVVRFSDGFDEVIHKMIVDQVDNYDLNAPVNLLFSNQRLMMSLDSNLYVLEKDAFRKMNPLEISQVKEDVEFVKQHKFYKSIKEISKFENVSNYHFFRPYDNASNFIIGFDEGYLKIPRSFEIIDDAAKTIAIDYVVASGHICDDINDLSFHPAQNDVSIQIKDFTFNNHSIPRKYKLKNWDDQWYDIPLDGQINFINLDDGKYDLAISDHNNNASKFLSFTIAPHWYESWKGGLLYAAFAFLSLWYLNKRNQKNLNLKTERLQKEKEREIESERMKAKNDKLEREVIYKSKMLANSTMALVQKNKMLSELKAVIAKDDLSRTNNRQYKQRLYNLINRNIDNDKDWEIFEKNFAEVHEDFLAKLKVKYPDITAGELKLAAYIRMNLSSKEIAPLLNISVRSVENKRYRLRKKMGIGHDNNLSEHLLRL